VVGLLRRLPPWADAPGKRCHNDHRCGPGPDHRYTCHRYVCRNSPANFDANFDANIDANIDANVIA
jgi:hypothetical protein